MANVISARLPGTENLYKAIILVLEIRLYRFVGSIGIADHDMKCLLEYVTKAPINFNIQTAYFSRAADKYLNHD
jgi:hypothetical protein